MGLHPLVEELLLLGMEIEVYFELVGLSSIDFKVPIIFVRDLLILDDVLLHCDLVLRYLLDSVLLLDHTVLDKVLLLLNLLYLLVLVSDIGLLLFSHLLCNHQLVYLVGFVYLQEDGLLLVEEIPLLLGFQLHLVGAGLQEHLRFLDFLSCHPYLLLYLEDGALQLQVFLLILLHRWIQALLAGEEVQVALNIL